MKSDVYNPDPNHICMWFEIRLKSGLESINGQIGFHVVFFFSSFMIPSICQTISLSTVKVTFTS